MRITDIEKAVSIFVDEVRKNSNITVLTGAGISTPSGIPDFRSKNGVYAKYSQKIFDIDYFHYDRENFYNFAKEEIFKMVNLEPNSIHYLFKKLEDLGKIKGFITQNIDNLHIKAGIKNVAEIHGNGNRWYCEKCGKTILLTEGGDKYLIENSFRCECNGFFRPEIVFFGEMLPLNEFSKAEKWAKSCDLFITAGTSLVVYPATQLPVEAKRNGAKLVILNNQPTPLDELADIVINVELEEFSKKVLENL